MTYPASFIALQLAERIILCFAPPDPAPFFSSIASICISPSVNTNALASSVSTVADPSGAELARTTFVTSQTFSTSARARLKTTLRSSNVDIVA